MFSKICLEARLAQLHFAGFVKKWQRDDFYNNFKKKWVMSVPKGLT